MRAAITHVRRPVLTVRSADRNDGSAYTPVATGCPRTAVTTPWALPPKCPSGAEPRPRLSSGGNSARIGANLGEPFLVGTSYPRRRFADAAQPPLRATAGGGKWDNLCGMDAETVRAMLLRNLGRGRRRIPWLARHVDDGAVPEFPVGGAIRGVVNIREWRSRSPGSGPLTSAASEARTTLGRGGERQLRRRRAALRSRRSRDQERQDRARDGLRR